MLVPAEHGLWLPESYFTLAMNPNPRQTQLLELVQAQGGAAAAVLEELRLDYEDYLRQRSLPLWPEDDPRRKALVARRCTTADAVADWVREQHRPDRQNGPDGPPKRRVPSMQSMPSIRSTYPEIAANAALVLIGVACALLD